MKRKIAGLLFTFLMCVTSVNGFCGGKKEPPASLDGIHKDIAELQNKTKQMQESTDKSLQEINKRLDNFEVGQRQTPNRSEQNIPAERQSPSAKNGEIKIEDRGLLRKPDIVEYIIRGNNPDVSRGYIEKLIDTYFREAEKEKINPDLAVAQMCHATNFLKNKELRNDFNYAGLAPVPEKGKVRFNDMTQGVLAHIQHLKGYTSGVSRSELKEPLVDPRWNMLDDFRGKIDTLNELSKKWSPRNSTEYERKITGIIEDLRRFSSRQDT